MATPLLDTVILQARAALKDLYNKSTGARITAASEDGKRWSVTDLVDLLIVPGINKLMDDIAGGLPPYENFELKGNVLGQFFDSYRKDSGALAITQGTDAYGTAPLPSDFGWIESAAFRPGNATHLRLMPTVPGVIDSMREGRNREVTTTPKYYIMGTSLYLHAGTPLNFSSDKVEIKYIARQVSVTQGGSTDILLRSSLTPLLLMEIKALSRGFKA